MCIARNSTLKDSKMEFHFSKWKSIFPLLDGFVTITIEKHVSISRIEQKSVGDDSTTIEVSEGMTQ